MSRRHGRHVAGLLVGVSLTSGLLTGCPETHHQSALHPAGPAAADIAWLIWALTAVLTVVFVVTMGLTAAAVVRRRRRDEPSELGVGFVVVSGIAIPSVILFGILVLSLQTTLAVSHRESAVTVQIVGHQFWWGVIYPDAGVVDANHLVLPAGVPVRVELRSADVIHSLWVPNLHGKMDLIPERTNIFWLQADAPGSWRGVCAEFCGAQHAKMAFTVEALEPDAFEAWLAERSAAADASERAGANGGVGVAEGDPATDRAADRGREVFVAQGCAACHAVRGVSTSDRGPDLTHLRGRPTLGAGAVPNSPESLEAWIRDPQAFKPGNLMPPAHMTEDDLDALVRWLWSSR